MKEKIRNVVYDVPASIVKDLIDRWTSKTPKSAKIVQYTMITIGVTATVATVVLPSIPTLPFWIVPVAGFVSAIGTQFIKE